MKKSTRIILIVASALALAGLIICGIALAMGAHRGELVGGFGIKAWDKNTHNVFVPVSNIEIDVTYSDVRFAPSSDENIYISAYENKKEYYDVTVENDTLKIRYMDIRMWYEYIGITVSDDYFLTVYLPAGEYENLNITSASGEVYVPSGYTFGSAKVTTSSGEIEFAANVLDTLEITTASGEADISGIQSDTAKIYRTSSSGDTGIKNTRVNEIRIQSASGETELEACDAEKIILQSSSGEISLEMCDARYIEITTSSGEVEATLLSDKAFYTDTASGHVRVPLSVKDASECHVQTNSGNIEIRVVGK